MKRFEYVLNLNVNRLPQTAVPEWLTCRPPTTADTAVLADLMMDAYPGTIDFDGSETWGDALHEIENFFDGVQGPPLLDCSRLLLVGDEIASTCLVGMWDARQRPLIYYVMTAAMWKEQGLAKLGLCQALQALADAGYDQVNAVITNGNRPSESLFCCAGFKQWTAQKVVG